MKQVKIVFIDLDERQKSEDELTKLVNEEWEVITSSTAPKGNGIRGFVLLVKETPASNKPPMRKWPE